MVVSSCILHCSPSSLQLSSSSSRRTMEAFTLSLSSSIWSWDCQVATHKQNAKDYYTSGASCTQILNVLPQRKKQQNISDRFTVSLLLSSSYQIRYNMKSSCQLVYLFPAFQLWVRLLFFFLKLFFFFNHFQNSKCKLIYSCM